LTAKDVLCHIVFWNKYYEETICITDSWAEPYIFPSKGGLKRNQEGVEALRHYSINSVVAQRSQSQSSLFSYIHARKVTAMDVSSQKQYSTEKFFIRISGLMRDLRYRSD
jgi:hypothetical protein